MGSNATQVYSLKESTKRLNANAHRYTDDQLAFISEQCKEWLHFFGYAKLPQDCENMTGFFEYDGSNEELNEQYQGFKLQNTDMVNWVCQLTD